MAAATTTVRELLWKVSSLLNDTAPQFNRWTEQELVSFLNDAQLAITKFLPSACSRIDRIRLAPGTRQSIETIPASRRLHGDGSTPAGDVFGVAILDFIRNMGADGNTPGDAIPKAVDRRMIDVTRPNWHTRVGPKVRQVVYDPKTPKYFYVDPGAPADTQVWIEIGYTARPTPIPNTGTPGAELYAWDDPSPDTTTISLTDEWVEDLVNYVCARACMKKSEYTSDKADAATFVTLFVNNLNAAVQALTGYNPNLKRLPMAPEPVGAAS